MGTRLGRDGGKCGYALGTKGWGEGLGVLFCDLVWDLSGRIVLFCVRSVLIGINSYNV